MDYKKARELIGTKPSKKLDGNTYLVRDGDKLAVRLHQTNILTYEPTGRVILDSGGWKTLTTKERLNRYLPYGFSIGQISNVWYLFDKKGKQWLFRDGMIIGIRGGLKDAKRYTPKIESRVAKLKKRINAYVKAYIDSLFAGNVPPPSGGDCWDCAMRTKEGQPLGEISKSDHILQHIREKYYVPSLLVNAIESYPVSIMAKGIVGDIWGAREHQSLWSKFAQRQLSSSLRRYIYRNVGLSG